ncbi:MAG: hypothetical protein CL582_23140 [Alteromonadaceae bacterium]|nr:hypothetical protein [Alteromonadaceae bacterium]
MKKLNCSKCEKEKSLDQFYKNSSTRRGFQSWCKTCNKTHQGKWNRTERGKECIRKRDRRRIEEGYYLFGNGKVGRLRIQAEKKGLSFSLTANSFKQWWMSSKEICVYCNITIEGYRRIRDFIVSYDGENYEINKFRRCFISQSHHRINDTTVDRIDSSIGYEIDNIVKACWICNYCKGSLFTYKQWKMVAPSLISDLKKEIRYIKRNSS